MKANARIILFFGCLFFFLGAFFTSGENNDLLDIEKRRAAGVPTVETHGIEGLPVGWDEYISDHFPFRHKLIKLSGEISRDLFGSIRSDSAVIGKNEWLFLNNIGLTSPRRDYQGTNLFNDDRLAAIKTAADNLYSTSVEKGVDVAFVIVPNKETVYSRYLPDSYPVVNSLTRKEQVSRYLADNSPLKVLNLTASLKRRAETDDNIYFIADSHWNGKGAYIGAEEIFTGLGVPHIPFEEMTFSQGDKHESDIANLCGLPDKYTDVYDLTADKPIVRAKTEKNAALVGDSFRYELEQYFNRAFTNCYIKDSTAAGISEVVSHDIDTLVIVMVERNLGDMETVLNNCAAAIRVK